MRKAIVRIIGLAMLALLISAASFAQGQQGGAFAQFREDHKYTFQLMQMVRHIGIIDKDSKHTLTPVQAKQVLSVLKPLSSKSKLTQDEAKQALKDLKKVFTVDQLNAMARIKPPQMGRRPGGQGGPGGPGGQGGPGGPGANGNRQGNRMRWDPNAMKDFNPFYTKVSQSDPRSADRAKRWNDFYKSLDKKAKSAKPSPSKGKSKK